MSLQYLSLDLFLYDLCDSLGTSTEQREPIQLNFWQRIYGDAAVAKLPQLQAAEQNFSGYIELLGDQQVESFAPPDLGYYYPVKVGDTYALQIDYGGAVSNWGKPLNFDVFPHFKQQILHQQKQAAKLGQNWLISGQPTDPQQTSVAIAEACYQALSLSPEANWQRDLKKKGSIDGIMLFELERLDTIPDGNNSSDHVLICLFPLEFTKAEIDAFLEQFYRDFLRLCLYRNKILWVYEQSRQLKTVLKDMTVTIQQLDANLYSQIRSNTINLHQLQTTLADSLAISSKYETYLGYLQEQISTIETNLANYQIRVKSFKNRHPNSDLAFLDRLANFATEVCLPQIKTESLAFTAGLKPLESLIKTVQGITEIEKTKNDRHFNQTIAIATVGVSAASLFASTASNQSTAIVQSLLPTPPNQPTPTLNVWMSVLLPFSLSAAVGLFGAGVTAWLLNRSKTKTLNRRSHVKPKLPLKSSLNLPGQPEPDKD